MAIDFDALTDQAIDALADDDATKGADVLVEIANIWAKAGLPKRTFLEMRQFIINQAVERTDPFFIEEKLKVAEEKLYEKRTGDKPSCIIH